MNDKPRRRWFHFSLRTLLLAVTLLCLYLGWELRAVRQRQHLLHELKQGGVFHVVTADSYLSRYSPARPVSAPAVATIPLVRRWLGDQAIQEIWYHGPYAGHSSEAELRRITEAFPEAELRETLPEPCHPGCFPRGTLVDTPQGPRTIETLAAGDAILAVDPAGKLVTVHVASVFTTRNRLWRVTTDDAVLVTTETQPLCRADRRIVPAGQLAAGDEILRHERGTLQPTTVRDVSRTERIEPVFNLLLSDGDLFLAAGFVARCKPPAE